MLGAIWPEWTWADSMLALALAVHEDSIHDACGHYKDAAWNADQLSRRLRQGVERISLVPAEAVLGGLGSMTRDLARSEGREIALRLEGLDTEADRRVLQALKDPVLHLLRNAVGHGGEPPERRERSFWRKGLRGTTFVCGR